MKNIAATSLGGPILDAVDNVLDMRRESQRLLFGFQSQLRRDSS